LLILRYFGTFFQPIKFFSEDNKEMF